MSKWGNLNLVAACAAADTVETAYVAHTARFQGLEMKRPVFPGIGKFHGNFSKPRKKTPEIFQGLENGR